MKVAIVGTSKHLYELETMDIKQAVSDLLKTFPKDTLIISGGAIGVDNIAKILAENMGFSTRIFSPKVENWEHYKRRNLQIAQECDELYCFTIPVRPKKVAGKDCYHHPDYENYIPHEKTAGCWTGEEAKKLNKKFTLTVVTR